MVSCFGKGTGRWWELWCIKKWWGFLDSMQVRVTTCRCSGWMYSNVIGLAYHMSAFDGRLHCGGCTPTSKLLIKLQPIWQRFLPAPNRSLPILVLHAVLETLTQYHAIRPIIIFSNSAGTNALHKLFRTLIALGPTSCQDQTLHMIHSGILSQKEPTISTEPHSL